MDRDGWMDLLGLAEHELPRLLVLEATWWRADALALRLPSLSDVRELGVPDLWHGWHDDVPVVYCPAYGSARAVEPVHMLGTIGSTPSVVQIGSCGGLQRSLRPGDIVLPERVTIGEGTSQYYGAKGTVSANLGKVTRASSLLAARGVYAHRGPTVTTGALLAQPESLVRSWEKNGHLAVDLESSAVFSAALAFGMRAAALLYVWDLLPRRSMNEPFTEAEEQAHEDASQAVWDVALALA